MDGHEVSTANKLLTCVDNIRHATTTCIPGRIGKTRLPIDRILWQRFIITVRWRCHQTPLPVTLRRAHSIERSSFAKSFFLLSRYFSLALRVCMSHSLPCAAAWYHKQRTAFAENKSSELFCSQLRGISLQRCQRQILIHNNKILSQRNRMKISKLHFFPSIILIKN